MTDYYLPFIGKKTEAQRSETLVQKELAAALNWNCKFPEAKPAESSFIFEMLLPRNQKGFEILFGESNNHGNHLMGGGGKTPESLIFIILELRM